MNDLNQQICMYSLYTYIYICQYLHRDDAHVHLELYGIAIMCVQRTHTQPEEGQNRVRRHMNGPVWIMSLVYMRSYYIGVQQVHDNTILLDDV